MIYFLSEKNLADLQQLGETPSGMKTSAQENRVAQAIGSGGGEDDAAVQARLDSLRKCRPKHISSI